jgi:SAM-dependent methyltransferase
LCGHQFIALDDVRGHIERTYGDDYFYGSGTGYSNYLGEERLLLARGKWYARLLSQHCPPGSVLDVGAAAGFTLRAFSQAGWQCHGIEPNRSMAEFAQQRFGISVDPTSLETWKTDQCFDLLTMLQVLPHFADPHRALQKCSQMLRSRGLLLVETWDRDSWMARLAGRHWHERNPPSVLHWFSKTGLIRLARATGFEPIAKGFLMRWIDAAHAKSLLAHRASGSAVYRSLLTLANLIPDRVAIPYLADDLFWALFRKSPRS